MITSEKMKLLGKQCGADLAGITSMDRFEGAPKQMDPRYIFPDAKAMIVLGFRILKGTLRGIEEGTFFSAYSSMGYGGINLIQQPMVLWNFCKLIEDAGYEAVPIHNDGPWAACDANGADPLSMEQPRKDWSRAVSPDKPSPDVFVNMRIAAFCAGLGEIGYSKVFLTPELGPRVRFAVVITDAPLDPDPLYEGKLCDRCMACVNECSGCAISKTKTIKITVAGRELEWGELDFEKCSMAYCGGNKETNPFMVTPEDEKVFTTPPYDSALNYKLRTRYEYGRAIEGARGCIRACMIHLEQQGKLKNKFINPFRRRKPWKLPL